MEKKVFINYEWRMIVVCIIPFIISIYLDFSLTIIWMTLTNISGGEKRSNHDLREHLRESALPENQGNKTIVFASLCQLF